MFRSKGILIALVIECSLSGMVCAQSKSQINNEEARYVLDKMLATRKKMRNLQCDFEYTTWRDQELAKRQYNELASRMKMKRTLEQLKKAILQGGIETSYQKYSIVLDSNNRGKMHRKQSGLVDSSGTRLPYGVMEIRAWDGHTGVSHSRGAKGGSAALDDSPPHALTHQTHPWRSYTGIFADRLAKAIEAEKPVNVETLPDGKYQVSYFNSPGNEYVGIIDPEKGFSCTSMTIFTDGIERSYYTAKYEEFADVVWFPVTATHVNKSVKGIEEYRNIMKTSNVKINDPNFSEDLFHVDLPKGTRVTDKVLGIRYVVGDSMSNKVQSGANIDKAMTEQQINSLVGKPVPQLKDFNHKIDVDQTRDRMILLCFFDMEQRPSRNCIMRLAKQARQLKQKGVTVVAVQASKINENKLNEWVKKNNIPFPIGMVQGDVEKTRFAWGVRSLPWLILTDKEHIVRAEGFGINELDEKITTLRK